MSVRARGVPRIRVAHPCVCVFRGDVPSDMPPTPVSPPTEPLPLVPAPIRPKMLMNCACRLGGRSRRRGQAGLGGGDKTVSAAGESRPAPLPADTGARMGGGAVRLPWLPTGRLTRTKGTAADGAHAGPGAKGVHLCLRNHTRRRSKRAQRAGGSKRARACRAAHCSKSRRGGLVGQRRRAAAGSEGGGKRARRAGQAGGHEAGVEGGGQ